MKKLLYCCIVLLAFSCKEKYDPPRSPRSLLAHLQRTMLWNICKFTFNITANYRSERSKVSIDGMNYEVRTASQWTKKYWRSTEPPQHFPSKSIPEIYHITIYHVITKNEKG